MCLRIKRLLNFCRTSIILWLAVANYLFGRLFFNEVYGYACGNVGAL